jgi:hypothetical protein
MAARRPGRRHIAPLTALVLGIALLVSGCGLVSTVSPAPTPADFQGIALTFTTRGLSLDHAVAGDAGCPDSVLTPTAIGFDASGLDQPTVVRIHVYIFADKPTYERLRATVDNCARSYVTDPSTFASVEVSPFVIAGQGPWGPKFEQALRDGLEVAAGTGG